MPLPLPNLDTRRWTDLVDDGIAQIPRYAPAWTDYNAHDPGITLLELFAWIAEMDVYRTNRVPPRHLLKFLELLGFPPKPPEPARAPLTFTGSGTVPSGTQFKTAAGTAFSTLRDMTIGPAALAALQVDAGDGAIEDRTSQLMAGASVEILGHAPVSGSAAYFGFSELPAGAPLSLYFRLAEAGGGIAALEWEAFTGGGWTPASATLDRTRSWIESGEIELAIPAGLTPTAIGEAPASLFYLRCRAASASYDATPLMVRVEPNTMVAVQAVAEIGNYSIAAAAAISGAAPAAGDSISFHCAIDSAGIIQAIDFLPPGTAGDPVVRVIGYTAPSVGNSGSLAMEMVHVVDPFWLPDAPIEEPSLLVFTLSGANWQQWTRRPDLDSSTRTDFHFAADPTSGQVTFGDGERSRALPPDALVFAQYRVTQAGAGNVSANQVTESPLAGIAVANLGPGWGGADQEDLESATGRAAALLYCHDPRSPHPPTNGVNLLDFERMALHVPHTRVARAKAYANLDGRYPCLRAPGTVTVVIIPDMQTAQPTPSAHLLSAVAQYICPRRLVCTQVQVVGPVYVAVSVAAHVAIEADADPGATQAAIVAALNAFLDPLTGGPHGTGWPFGRDVYRTEILQLIAAVDGVDYVTGLTLSGDGAVPSCGNLSVCAGSLVSPGTHRITIAMEAD